MEEKKNYNNPSLAPPLSQDNDPLYVSSLKLAQLNQEIINLQNRRLLARQPGQTQYLIQENFSEKIQLYIINNTNLDVGLDILKTIAHTMSSLKEHLKFDINFLNSLLLTLATGKEDASRRIRMLALNSAIFTDLKLTPEQISTIICHDKYHDMIIDIAQNYAHLMTTNPYVVDGFIHDLLGTYSTEQKAHPPQPTFSLSSSSTSSSSSRSTSSSSSNSSTSSNSSSDQSFWGKRKRKKASDPGDTLPNQRSQKQETTNTVTPSPSPTD